MRKISRVRERSRTRFKIDEMVNKKNAENFCKKWVVFQNVLRSEFLLVGKEDMVVEGIDGFKIHQP